MANFTPQQIEQFLQDFFDVVGARQYKGARYVPIFGRAGSDTIEWDDAAPYEPLTVVMHQGVSYVSRRYVPAGIPITHTGYWVETYRFNAQVEQYRQEVLGFQGQIDTLRDDMESDYTPFPTAGNPKYGTSGQVLSTLGDGTTRWEDPVIPSDDQAAAVIGDWLDDHPEATTTVEDDSITYRKLASDLKGGIAEATSLYAPRELIEGVESNPILAGNFVSDYYRAPSLTSNSDYVFFITTVESGVTYAFQYVRYIANANTLLNSTSSQNVSTWESTYTGEVYLTVSKANIYHAFFTTQANYLDGNYATRDSCVIRAAGISDGYDLRPLQIDGITLKEGSDILEATVKQIIDGVYYFANPDTLVVTRGNNAAYKTYIIPAAQGLFRFSDSVKFVFASAYLNAFQTTALAQAQNVTSFTCPAGTKYLFIANQSQPLVCAGDYTPIQATYEWDSLSRSENNEYIKERLYGKGFASVSGNLSSGNSLTLPKSNVKKSNAYSFMGKISSFSKLLIGHGKTEYDSTYVEIDSTNIIVHRYTVSDVTNTYAHGLTISSYIYVNIVVGVGTANISIESNGATFTQEVSWNGDSNAQPFAESDGSTLTACKLTWCSSDFRSPLWLFGDSYFGMTSNSRWCYYLVEDGFDKNVLLNAYPGQATGSAMQALSSMIGHYGMPKQIFWALGMNDGGDSGNVPSTNWMNGISSLIDLCAENDIELILATIPTVPDINHEAKNSYVRSSGYRYVDFASAVGAQSDGTWYSGMLSSDNVHPDAPGAVALYNAVLNALPEVTYAR